MTTEQRASDKGHGASLLVLILANLVPLIGVVFFAWDLLSVLLLYWLESLFIAGLGVFQALARRGVRALGSVLLFILVVISLGAAHLAALVVLAQAAGVDERSMPDLSSVSTRGLLDALGAIYAGGLGWIILKRPELLAYGLPALVISRLIQAGQARRSAPPDRGIEGPDPLRQALRRVIVLQLALLLGSALMVWLQAEDMLAILVLLIVFKLLFDISSWRANATA